MSGLTISSHYLMSGIILRDWELQKQDLTPGAYLEIIVSRTWSGFTKDLETWGTFIQLTSGLEELKKQQSCIVYPNPAGQFIEVQFQNQSPEQVKHL